MSKLAGDGPSRRAVLAVAGVLATGLALPGWTKLPVADDVSAGFARAYADLLAHWWDPVAQHLRPTLWGIVHAERRYPAVWEMAIAHTIFFWHWRLTGSAATRDRIRGQFEYVRTLWSARQLSTVDPAAFPDPASAMVHAVDDAAWLCLYYVQVHRALNEGAALDHLVAILPTIRRRFADPNHGGLGLLYATAEGDPEHQGVSTSFDAMLAVAALYAYRHRPDAALLGFARHTFAWIQAHLKHPLGVYFVEADIRPQIDGRPNPRYRQPIGGDRPRDLCRGGSVAYLAGTMAMVVLGVRLHAITRDPRCLIAARATAAAIVRSDAVLRHGLFVDARDGWTEGSWMPAYAETLLADPSLDPQGANRAAILNTARAIIAQRTVDGLYGADWVGPEYDPSHRWATWAAQGRSGGTGSGAGMAEPEQMMTSCQSIAVIAAAALLVRGGAQSRAASAANTSSGPMWAMQA